MGLNLFGKRVKAWHFVIQLSPGREFPKFKIAYLGGGGLGDPVDEAGFTILGKRVL